MSYSKTVKKENYLNKFSIRQKYLYKFKTKTKTKKKQETKQKPKKKKDSYGWPRVVKLLP